MKIVLSLIWNYEQHYLSDGSAEKPLAYFFAEKVSKFFNFLNLHFQGDHFGMFIVLTLHRESLRQMMNQGRVNRSIKIQVLEMLKPQVCGSYANHGDIKDFLVLIF